jgi:hypothetical protein
MRLRHPPEFAVFNFSHAQRAPLCASPSDLRLAGRRRPQAPGTKRPIPKPSWHIGANLPPLRLSSWTSPPAGWTQLAAAPPGTSSAPGGRAAGRGARASHAAHWALPFGGAGTRAHGRTSICVGVRLAVVCSNRSQPTRTLTNADRQARVDHHPPHHALHGGGGRACGQDCNSLGRPAGGRGVAPRAQGAARGGLHAHRRNGRHPGGARRRQGRRRGRRRRRGAARGGCVPGAGQRARRGAAVGGGGRGGGEAAAGGSGWVPTGGATCLL